MFSFFTNKVNAFGAGVFYVGPRSIKQGVAYKVFSFSAQDAEQDLFSCPSLVCGYYQRHAGNLLYGFLKAKKAGTAGIRFVALHYARPLVAAHGAGAAVGKQVY